MRDILIIILLQFGLQAVAQQESTLDSLLPYFEEFEQKCKKDNGDLWGKSLFGPLVLIDESSRTMIANEPDSSELLKPYKGYFIGKFPDAKIISCGTTEFGGKKWAMVSELDDNLLQTCVHESFHRIQKIVGFDCGSYDNSHIDETQARLSIKLELLALKKAVNLENEEKESAIKDALLIRQERRNKYPASVSDENKFEIHEGLAKYTEFKLCSNSNAEFKTIADVQVFVNSDYPYMRCFGYYTGSLYAYLLDESGDDWRKGLTCVDDLGQKLCDSYKLDLIADTSGWFESVKIRYGYDTIYNKEMSLNAEKIRKKEAEIKRFTKDPVLEIATVEANYGLKSHMYSLDSLGTIIPVVDISDKWGFLSVTDIGCLLMEGKVRVTAEDISIQEQLVTGLGWELKLNDGWIIEENKENYTLKLIKNTR